MSLHCATAYGGDDFDWYWAWSPDDDPKPLATVRSRKCCSCKVRLKPGDQAAAIERWRNPVTDIEERIAGDEVPLATWYLCEKCFDLSLSLDELGYCFDLGNQSLADQIKEYKAEGGTI